MKQRPSDQYSEEEAQQRFMAALKAAHEYAPKAAQEHGAEGRSGAI
jgi:hypothetical protein